MMLDKKRIPTPLIKPSERPAIPIVTGEIKTSFRRFRIGLRLLGMFLKFFYFVLIRRLDARVIGRMFGDFCQKTGVLWVKLGQLLSMRSDLFPTELCEELARLQDRVEGFSPQLVKEILEIELGGPLEKFFSRFEMVPCAAASIAQVHRAFLADEKTWVAIKVRRPEVDRVFTLDLGMIRGLLLLLHRFSIMSYMRWPDMLWEMEQVFQEELDYRYEISNQYRLRKTLAHHDIYVPMVFERYCTRKVLVMEYIEGVSMTDFLRTWKSDPARIKQWTAENGIDVDKVGKQLFQSYLRQVLEDNLFHADLHPGNILLLRDNRVVLLDFGSMGSNEGDLQRKYDVFLQALSSGQYAKAIDVFLLIMPDVPSAQLAPAKEEMQRRLHSWDSRCRVKELPYKVKSTNMVFDEMMKVMGKYGVKINWAFFKVLRGWTTLDTSLRELIPGADLPRLMQTYIQGRGSREFKKVIRKLPGDLLKLQNLIDYPREFSEMAIYRGAGVRRLAQVFEGTATRVSRLVATGFEMGSAFFFFLSVVFGFIFFDQHVSGFDFPAGHVVREVLDIFPVLDPQVWLLVVLFTVNGFLSLAQLARRFRKQE
ncbi:MAG: AarF/ABC1/UbiB kinase family protein [bacterium]|nr:AarF/ABC1/UbiB kinase family protein [bacterium]